MADGISHLDAMRIISSDSRTGAGRRADFILAGALVCWILCFLTIRAIALAHGGSPLPWDSAWYYQIAAQGYHFSGDIMTQQSVAFLPLFPMTVRPFLWAGLPAPIAMLLVCIGSAIGGTLLLQRALEPRMGEMWSALACALLIASPFSIYFLNGYSEALYFLFFGAFWWALLRRKDFVLAAAMAGLATGIRPFGLLLAVVWAVALLLDVRRGNLSWRRAMATFVLFGPLTIAGLLAVSLYYYFRFGDLFLYRNVLLAWSQDLVQGLPQAGFSMPFDNSFSGMLALFRLGTDISLDVPPTVAHLLICAFVLLLPFAAFRLPPEILTYGISLLLFCIVASAGYAVGRHMATNLVLPMAALALIWRGRRPNAEGEELVAWQSCLITLLFVSGLIVQAFFLTRYFHSRWVS